MEYFVLDAVILLMCFLQWSLPRHFLLLMAWTCGKTDLGMAELFPQCETTLLHIYSRILLFHDIFKSDRIRTNPNLQECLTDGKILLLLYVLNSVCWLPHKLPSCLTFHVTPSPFSTEVWTALPAWCTKEDFSRCCGARNCGLQKRSSQITLEELRYVLPGTRCQVLLERCHLESPNIEFEFSMGLSESHKVVTYILNRNFR